MFNVICWQEAEAKQIQALNKVTVVQELSESYKVNKCTVKVLVSL